MANSNGTPANAQLAELVSIKRLLVFSLLKSGASQSEVAVALGMDQSGVSRMFPKPVGRSTRRSKRRK
jgi:predicted transcriptional regulator